MSTEVAVHPELAALRAQADLIAEILDDLEAEGLQRPTRLPPMNVRELVAHTAVGLLLSNKMLAETVKGNPTHDRVSWWRSYDPDEAGEGIVSAAVEKAAKRDDVELVAWWRSIVDAALEAFAGGPPGRVVGLGDIRITAVDLAATRVLELGVHGMDLGHATLRGEGIDPKAAEIVTEILEGLLEAPLPLAMGWDRRTFILTGTGRRRLEPNERYVLGPLADRFPLIR